MKKYLLGIVLALSCFALASCGTETEKVDIAHIIFAGGTLEDGGFNQGSWAGIKDFADDNKLNAKYYHAAEETIDSTLDSITLAIGDGAEVVVLPGYNFEVVVYRAQSMYPDVKFILLDGAPHSGDYVYDIKDNTAPIFYQEEEAGFLAGYALVKDGFRKLGFLGGKAYPAVIGFGYGFINGADIAAQELELTPGAVELKFNYAGNFEATNENQTLAGSWYNSGTEVIFSCGGAVGFSVMAAAEVLPEKYVVGVDIDQSGDHERVITSAIKNLAGSVYQTLQKWKDGEFPGGKVSRLTVVEDGVGLPIENSRFRTFTVEDYNAIYQRLVDDTDNIRSNIPLDEDYAKASEVPTVIVAVEDLYIPPTN